jgi:hypothetical protein
MMKHHLLSALLMMFSIIAYAQAPQIQWGKQFSGTAGINANSVAVAADHSIYLTGGYSGTLDLDPGPGVFNVTAISSSDIFVVKLDSNANFVWGKTYGSSGSPMADEGTTIKLDHSGNVIVTGFFLGTADFNPGGSDGVVVSSGDFDIFILKLSAEGNFNWVKKIGGSLLDDPSNLFVDSDDNIYLSGRFSGTVDFDPGPGFYMAYNAGTLGMDGFVLKLDSAGLFQWVIPIGGAGNDLISDAIVDQNFNVYILGAFRLTVDFDPGPGTEDLTSLGMDDIFVAKFDAGANFLWVKHIGSSATETPSQLCFDLSGNLVFNGIFNGNTDFDPGAGTAFINTNSNINVFVAKLDSDGNYIWATQIDGSGNKRASDIAVDAHDRIYSSGFFNGTADFDGSVNDFLLSAVGGDDFYVLMLTGSGNFYSAVAAGSSGTENCRAVAIDNNNDIYLFGDFAGNVDFGFQAPSFPMTSVTNSDGYLCKYTSSFALSEQSGIQVAKQAVLFPNPANRFVMIALPLAIENSLWRIFNLSGEVVEAGTMASPSALMEINIAHLPDGVYFLQMMHNQAGISNHRFIIAR